MHDNTSTNSYANISPSEHNIKRLSKIMSIRNKTELDTLQAVNNLASFTYEEVSTSQRRWLMVKRLSIIVSLMLLVITMVLLYTSPIIDQSEYEWYDPRVWGVGLYLAIAAILAAIILDIGRSFILDRGNNDNKAWSTYLFFTVVSIMFSTIGMLAIASFYASSNQSDTAESIDTARQYTIDHASMASVTVSSLNAQQSAFDKKLHTKGSGYYKSDHERDTTRLASERIELKKYLSAVATLDGKQDLLANTDSSNWLYNTFATMIKSTVATAGFILGVLVNLIAELMAMVAHSRLIKLNARLEITDVRWNSALMAMDRAVIVNGSSLQQMSSFDTFQHNFSLPTKIMSQYHSTGVTVGSFASNNEIARGNDSVIEIVEDNQPLTTTTNNDINDIRTRYERAKNTAIGSDHECPVCRVQMIKKGIKIFCSNNRNTKEDGSNCADEYHNIINPQRAMSRN